MAYTPSSAASKAIASVLRGEGEARIGDDELEVLGHVATIEHGADLEADLVLAAQRSALAQRRRLNLGELFLGRGDEFAALAGALGRQLGVATDNETLAGIVVRNDLRHVALVEQRPPGCDPGVQEAALGRQGLDGRGAQRRDPVEAGGLDVGVDARPRDSSR